MCMCVWKGGGEGLPATATQGSYYYRIIDRFIDQTGTVGCDGACMLLPVMPATACCIDQAGTVGCEVRACYCHLPATTSCDCYCLLH